MTNRQLVQLVALATGKPIQSYTETQAAQKVLFHRLAKACLNDLVKFVGLAPSTYDIRTNMAGVAVCGETTLHGECIYVQLSQSSLGGEPQFMYRSCRGRKDYKGGPNHWMKWAELLDLPAAARKLAEVMS